MHAHDVQSPLQGIWLGGNLLTRLPQHIGNFPALNTLSAPGNVLTEVPATLEGLTTLQQLVLSGNELAALPAGISALGEPQIDEGRAAWFKSGGMLQAVPGGIAVRWCADTADALLAIACIIACLHVFCL